MSLEKQKINNILLTILFLVLVFVAYLAIAYSINIMLTDIIDNKKIDFSKITPFMYLMSIIPFTFIVLKGYIFKYRHQKIWVSILSMPLFSTFSQMLWVGVGIYFSLQSANLLAWWTDGKNTILVADVIVALSLLLFSSFVFLESQLSTNATNIDLNKQSKKKVDTLEHVIRLAPPGDFSSLFALYVDQVEEWAYIKCPKEHSLNEIKLNKFLTQNKIKSLNEVNKDHDLNELSQIGESYKTAVANQKKHIRTVLICFARLAAIFDNIKLGEGNHTYRANIMLKKTQDITISDATVNFLPSIVKNSHIHSVNYYLTLDPDYSISIYSRSRSLTDEHGSLKNFKPDNISPLILPVFSGHEDMLYNCFGAPRAVATAESQFVPDTHKAVQEWATQNPGMQVIKAAEKYYHSSKKARSLLSIPLLLSRASAAERECSKVFGSINIYRNNINLLSADEGKKDQFVDIMTPLTQSLSRIISLHMTTENKYTAITNKINELNNTE